MQRPLTRLSIFFALLVVSDCAGRDEMGIFATRIDATTIRLTAIAFDDERMERSALLLRAAQETLKYGRSSFLVVDPADSMHSERFWSVDRPPFGGFVAPYGPDDMLIRMMKRQKQEEPSPNSFDAAEVVRNSGNVPRR